MLGTNKDGGLDNVIKDMQDQASELIKKLELGDISGASEVIHSINAARDKTLYQEVGKLTRGLHEAIVNFQIDTDSKVLTEEEKSEMADATDNLDYVITLTQKSADKTMDMVEEGMPISTNLAQEAKSLHADWERLQRREMSADEFRDLNRKIGDFLGHTAGSADVLNEKFNNILMAQDFQDLTGQVIKRVIGLVQEVESSLVNLMRLAGQVEQITGVAQDKPAEEAEKPKENSVEAEGPIVNAEIREDVVSSQDDVDDLLSSLGF